MMRRAKGREPLAAPAAPATAPAAPASEFVLPRLTPRLPLTYRAAELRYAAHHMYVNREHKLLYCAIPKVACTEWMKLFFRLMGKGRDNGRWNNDPHFRGDKPLFNRLMNETEATAIMNDPAWTKFAFFRDPAERLLSAYLDKFANGKRYATGSYAVRIFKTRGLNFSGFVDRVASGNRVRSNPDGLHPNTNPHWRPQRFMCNLEKFLPAYNFLGSFDRLADHAERLLRGAGLWEEYGASGWGKRGKITQLVHSAKAAVLPNATAAGFAMFRFNAAWHATKRMKPEQHDLFTPELLTKVRRAYRMDYAMFDVVGAMRDAPADGSAWGDAGYAARQTMGDYDRSFKDRDSPWLAPG